MSYTFCLLTATCVTGAPQSAAPAPTQMAAPASRITPAAPAPENPAARSWRFGDRLRGLFSRRTPDAPAMPEAPRPVPGPAVVTPQGAVSAQPMPQTPGGVIISEKPGQPAPHVAHAPPPDQYPLTAKEHEKVGHEQDYSWITGKLFRAPGGGDRWVLRYGAPYEVDRHGGTVLLAPHPELSKLHAGDLVCVHGKVVDGGRAARSVAGAGYQVESITLIERGGR